MPARLRNTLAVIAGFIIGNIVNITIITVGASLIPPPPGVDVTDAESLRSAIHLFEARHFVMPFLAHALGTLAGAFVACRAAVSNERALALVVGVLFLAGGVTASFMIPAPAWFIALDLLVAYLPMAWLAARLGARTSRGTSPALTEA